MPQRFSFKLLLVGWIALEGLLLIIVVSEIGWLGATVLGLASTLLGFGLLKQAGGDVFSTLQANLQSPASRETLLADHTLKGLGALFLVLPGFCSDLVGLALSSPSVRQQVMKLWKTTKVRQTKSSTDVLDLDPKDWRPSSEA